MESIWIEKELRKSGRIIERIDIFIAGICKWNNFELITCDKDFTKINSIKVKIIQ